MPKFLAKWLWVVILLPIVACSAKPKTVPASDAAATSFQAGKDYEVVNPTLEAPKPKTKVHVTEFFSYGCPACNHFEPELEAWLAKKPNYIIFDRVPVIFEPSWDLLARAYYTARSLGVAEKITPAIFEAIHAKGVVFNDEASLADFFAQYGVNKKEFDNTFNFSPGIDAQVLYGNNLMRKYQVMEVPTMLVEDKYKVTPRLTHGDVKRMLQIIDYLIQKEKLGKA